MTASPSNEVMAKASRSVYSWTSRWWWGGMTHSWKFQNKLVKGQQQFIALVPDADKVCVVFSPALSQSKTPVVWFLPPRWIPLSCKTAPAQHVGNKLCRWREFFWIWKAPLADAKMWALQQMFLQRQVLPKGFWSCYVSKISFLLLYISFFSITQVKGGGESLEQFWQEPP